MAIKEILFRFMAARDWILQNFVQNKNGNGAHLFVIGSNPIIAPGVGFLFFLVHVRVAGSLLLPLGNERRWREWMRHSRRRHIAPRLELPIFKFHPSPPFFFFFLRSDFSVKTRTRTIKRRRSLSSAEGYCHFERREGSPCVSLPDRSFFSTFSPQKEDEALEKLARSLAPPGQLKRIDAAAAASVINAPGWTTHKKQQITAGGQQ